MPSERPIASPPLSREQIVAHHVVGPPEPKPVRATEHCRHYGHRNTGLAGLMRGDRGGPSCAVGCDNRSEPGAASACMPPEFQNGRTCSQRENYTPEERATWLAWRDRHIRRTVVACSSIPDEGTSGHVPCRACGTGTITWAGARLNGHLHAACSTPGCFEVIQ